MLFGLLPFVVSRLLRTITETWIRLGYGACGKGETLRARAGKGNAGQCPTGLYLVKGLDHGLWLIARGLMLFD